MLLETITFSASIVLGCIVLTLSQTQIPELPHNKTTIAQPENDKLAAQVKSACVKCENPKDEEEKTWCSKNCANNFKARSIVVSMTTEEYCNPCIREIIPIILTHCDGKCNFEIMRKLQKLLIIFSNNPNFFEASSEMIYGSSHAGVSSASSVESIVEVMKHQGFYPPPPKGNQCGTIVLINGFALPEPVVEPIPQPYPELIPQPIPQPVPIPYIPQNQFVSSSQYNYEQVSQPSEFYQFREDSSSLQPFANVALSIPEETERKDKKEVKVRSFSQPPTTPETIPTPEQQTSREKMEQNVEDSNNSSEEKMIFDKNAQVDDETLQKYKKQLCRECINQLQMGNRKARECDAVCYWAIFSP